MLRAAWAHPDMHDKLIIKIKNPPAGNDHDEWRVWYAEVSGLGREILVEISGTLTSTADDRKIRLLEDYRARVLSIMSLAVKLMNDVGGDNLPSSTTSKKLH